MELQDSKSGSGKILRTIAAVTALLTAVAGLVGALTAAGAFDDESSHGPTTQGPTTQPSTQTTSATPSTGQVNPPTIPSTPPTPSTGGTGGTNNTASTEVEQRTAVTLAYAGDVAGCGLDISVDIGDRSFRPVGTSFVAPDVSIGDQAYRILGTITCPFVGQCEASGSGSIDIAPSRVFFVLWENVDFGLCDIMLAA